MIVRVVRLTLRPQQREEFQSLFDRIFSAIKAMPGCRSLKLLEDTRFPNIIVTLSEWDDEESLNAYRESAFFNDTWSKTKLLFAAPPVANSYRVVVD